MEVMSAFCPDEEGAGWRFLFCILWRSHRLEVRLRGGPLCGRAGRYARGARCAPRVKVHPGPSYVSTVRHIVQAYPAGS